MKKYLTTIVLIFVMIGFVNGQIIRYVTPSGAGSKNGTSWSNAYDNTQLQAAINETGVTEIWVATGTYKPTTGAIRTISFNLKNGVAVYGGFTGTETLLSQRNWTTNVTILSGDIGTVGANADNSNHVVYTSGLDNTAILDGFTIKGGKTEDGDYGGGVYNNSSSPTLKNIRITENYGYYGGGIFNGSSSSPVLNNCTIVDNLLNYEGGGIYNSSSSPVLTNCSITGNSSTTYGGGISNGGWSSPVLTNCLISNNSAMAGGGINNASNSSPILTNSTITGNTASYGGGGFYSNSSSPVIKNSIIWGNTAAHGNQIYNVNYAYFSLNYSCYGNGVNDIASESNGNINPDAFCINTDPEFANPNNDFRITGNSPCADAGNDAFNSETTDIRGAGFGRKLLKTNASAAGPIDMGAYEFKKGTDPEVPDVLRIYVKANASGLNNGTSWANAYTSLQSAITAAGRYYEIWVAAGTYYPTAEAGGTGDRYKTFQLKIDMAMYGGFAGTESSLIERNWISNATILSGDLGTIGVNTDNSYHVVYNYHIGSNTILDGFTIKDGKADDYGGGVYNDASSPTLINCTISGNSGYSGGGICNLSSFPVLNNCTISGNSTTYEGGGIFNSSSSLLLTKCTITGNSTVNFGGGISNNYSSSSILVNCLIVNNVSGNVGGGISNQSSSVLVNINSTISGNSAYYGGGIYNTNSTSTLNNSIVWGNTALTSSNQIYNQNGTTTLIYSCYANGTGDVSNSGGTFTPTNCINNNPKFINPNSDFRIAEASPCADAGFDAYNSETTDIRGTGFGRKLLKTNASATGTIDMGAYEYIKGTDPEVPEVLRIYVKADASGSNNGTSWANAFTSLQYALTNAPGNYEIWVAAGTYKPTTGTDQSISFTMKNKVSVYGGFAGTETEVSQRNWTTHVTILSGDIGTPDVNTDNSEHVVYNTGINSTALLDGFTIQSGGNSNYNYGGGIYNESSSPTFTNCTITGNIAIYYGGGIYNSNSSPTLTNCTISGNTATGYHGGGISNSSSSPTLINCTISGNHSDYDGGGVYNASSSPNMINCLIYGNSAGQTGGGVHNTSSSSPILNNCTVTANSAAWGGGVGNQSSTPTLNNSIIWGNTASGGGNQFYNSGTTTVNYSCYAIGSTNIYNETGGAIADANCITTDPNFVKVASNDFRIPGNSPCKNNGNNTYNATADDIRGQIRIQNTTIDMGAYEWTSGVDPAEVMTWTGTVSSNWNTPGNWNPNTVPLATSVVSIPDVTTYDPIVNENPESPAVCKNISIESGATLTVTAGKALTVSETITNNSAGGVIIQSDASGTGSLITGMAGGAGSAIVKRWMTTGAWHIVSAPLSGQLVSDFLTLNANVATNGTARGMMDYSPAGNAWNSFFTNSTDGSLGSGKGFSMRVGASDAAVTFTGSLQVGSQPATTSAGYWNCIGNPYTSAIGIATGSSSLSKFLDINAANFEESYGAIYVWNKPDASNGFYGNYTVISNTAPEFNDVQQGQAFMVNAKAGVSSFSFTSAMQIHSPALGLKSAKEVWPTIKLFAEVGLQKSSTIIAFNSGMTKGLDVTYDAGLLKGATDLIVYTKLVQDNGIPFAIQSLPSNEYNSLIIPVGIDFKTGGQVVFSAELLNLSPDCKVILEDKLTKTFTDLSERVYKVAIPANSVIADRFQLHTSDLISGLGDETLVGKLKVYPVRDLEIRIIGAVGQNTVATLYDVQGRVVLAKNLDEGNLNILPTPNIKPGLYLLSVKDGGNSQMFKILVRE